MTFGRFKKKPEYGEFWQDKTITDSFYDEIFNRRPQLHENVIEYIKLKSDAKTILEIGCGKGLYPIKFKNLFEKKQYTGFDISSPAIKYCKEHSGFEFICGDFIKTEFSRRFDLVYSLAVIDHVYDIDAFLEKIIKLTRKYAYINAYRGYDPTLEKHEMIWKNNLSCYLNRISHKQIMKVFEHNGLTQDEITIRPQQVGEKADFPIQTVIEINKKVETE